MSQEISVALVETPFFVRQAEAVVLENPVFPLLAGNVIRDENGKNYHLPVMANPETKQAADVARAQGKRRSPGRVDLLHPLKEVAERDELREQRLDPSLEKIRGFARKREQSTAGRKGRVTCFWKGWVGWMGVVGAGGGGWGGGYCSYQTGVARYDQVVVPSSLRHQVTRLAHDSGMAGHQGAQQTQAGF